MRIYLQLVLACICMAGAPPAWATNPPTIRQEAANLDNPGLGQPRAVSNWTCPFGKGTLRLTSGQVLPLMEGEREVGFYFKGIGEFSLPIDQADEVPAAKFNLDRNTKVKFRLAGDTWFLDLPIKEMNVLYEGMTLPAFGPADPQPLAELQSSREVFRKTYLIPGWRNRNHVILTARHNVPTQPAWYMNFLGDKGSWEFARDPWTTRSERLMFARVRIAREGSQDINDLVVLPISIRSLSTAPRTAVTPSLLLRNVDLDLEARANGTCRYAVVETFVPQLAGMGAINLRLLNILFEVGEGSSLPRSRGFDDPNPIWAIPHRLNVKGVTQDGQPLNFVHAENELLLELKNPTQQGLPFSLRIEVEGDFLVHPSGDNRWELGNEPWIPSTEFEGMKFKATAKIRSEKPYLPFATGQTLVRKEEDAFYVLETKMDQPTWSFFIAAGKYHVEEEVRNGLTVRVVSYAHKSASDAKLAALAHDIVSYYEKILGPFPVKELNVIQRNEWGAGQAPAGFLFMSNEAFNPLLGSANQWFSRGVNQRFAHEIAHQYWGNQVLVANWEENWISESFAQYCSALLLRTAKGESEFKRLLSEWKDLTQKQSEWGTVPTSYRIQDLEDPGHSSRIKFALLYGKGAILLNRIHQEIGDQAFATLLRSYQKSLRGRSGTTQDLINLIKLIAKRDYTSFFDQYLWTSAMPN